MKLKGKYVVFDDMGIECPVLFTEFVQHKDVRVTGKVLSAGMFSIESVFPPDDSQITGNLAVKKLDLRICVWGQSISLNVKSRLDVDAQLIREMFDSEKSLT